MPYRSTIDRFLRWNPWRRIDRRLAPRQQFQATISVSKADGHVFKGTGRDISKTGLGALVFGDLSVGELVLLRFQPPSEETEKLMKAVVRQKLGYRYGFEFKDRIALRLEAALG